MLQFLQLLWFQGKMSHNSVDTNLESISIKYYKYLQHFKATFTNNLANIYLFKVNNRNTRKRCEICSKLTIKISERYHWHESGVFTVNFRYISHLFLLFLLLTLNMHLFAWMLQNLFVCLDFTLFAWMLQNLFVCLDFTWILQKSVMVRRRSINIFQ